MDQHRKYALRIDNVYFLRHVGSTLRQATVGVPRTDLPENVVLLLRRLDRLAVRKAAKGPASEADRGA